MVFIGSRALWTAVPVVGLIAFSGARIAVSQETQGLVLNLEQSLEYSDNLDLRQDPISGFRSVTKLGFALNRSTNGQSLVFAGNTDYIVDRIDDRFENSTVNLRYSLFNKNSRLSFRSLYRDSEIDDVQRILEATDPADVDEDALLPDPSGVSDPLILTGEGTRINRLYEMNYVTGQAGPVQLRLNLSQAEDVFSNATDTSLFDRQTRRAGVSGSFRITPTTSMGVFFLYSLFEAEDTAQTERETFTYGVEMTTAIRPNLVLSTSLRQTDITTDTTSGRTQRNGPGFSLGLNQRLKNGTLGFNLDSINTVNGQRTTAQVSRVMTLQNEASLSFSVGATDIEDGDSSGLFSLSYAKAIRNGSFSLRLSQEANTGGLGNEVVTSRLTATYGRVLSPTTRLSFSASYNEEDGSLEGSEDRRQLQARANLRKNLNDLSSLSLGITYSDTQVTSPTLVDNQKRYGMRVAYQRSLTTDWDMVAAVEHSTFETNSGSTRNENAIRFGLSRQFSFRP